MRLQLTPGQTATDRAVELARKLEDAERDKQVLSKRIAELDATVASRNRALEEAGREVLAAREELMRSRAELEGWQQEMQGLREKLRSADKENLATLQATVSLLQHMLGPDEAPSEK
jgi:predicted nuclease with TOPRIM domain